LAALLPYSEFTFWAYFFIWGEVMNNQAFLSALEERVARYDLLCHPYYKAWTAGELTRDDLRHYATGYFHHVAAFPAYLSALHTRLEDGATRRAVLRNLCEEEIAGRPHSEMWLDFAEGMGADRDAVRTSEPMAEIAGLIRHFRRVATGGLTSEALATFYAYESQIPRIAKQKADGLAERYSADSRTCGYFTLHQHVDVEHAQVWRDLLIEQIDANPGQAEQALDAAENAAKALWKVLDRMEARRMAIVG
jgi:pyrroloquinoline-quinone synthase